MVEAMKIKGLTVEKLSLTTGVSERVIELLLAERFEELPAAPYVRGYLLKIAEALGLESSLLWETYGKYHEEIRHAGKKDTLPENRFALPKVSRKLVLGIAIGIVIAGFVISRFAWGGRTFTFTVNIPDGLVVATSTYVIEGAIRPGDQLTVNGATLYPHEDGTFKEEVTLVPEFNTFEFVVRRPLEDSRTFTKQIFYEVPTSTPLTTP